MLGLASAEDRRRFRELATIGQPLPFHVDGPHFTLVGGQNTVPPEDADRARLFFQTGETTWYHSQIAGERNSS